MDGQPFGEVAERGRLRNGDAESGLVRGHHQKPTVFLYYLMLVGCDVLLFHPEGKDEFRQLDPEQKLSFVFTYPDTSALEPFPTEKPQRKATVAYRSAKELDTVLHNEDSLMYKPWQFREHTPASVTLKTTYDELF